MAREIDALVVTDPRVMVDPRVMTGPRVVTGPRVMADPGVMTGPRVMAGLGPATHDFADRTHASRGWPASAGRDTRAGHDAKKEREA